MNKFMEQAKLIHFRAVVDVTVAITAAMKDSFRHGLHGIHGL